jgi:hypothetical protein
MDKHAGTLEKELLLARWLIREREHAPGATLDVSRTFAREAIHPMQITAVTRRAPDTIPAKVAPQARITSLGEPRLIGMPGKVSAEAGAYPGFGGRAPRRSGSST